MHIFYPKWGVASFNSSPQDPLCLVEEEVECVERKASGDERHQGNSAFETQHEWQKYDLMDTVAARTGSAQVLALSGELGGSSHPLARSYL